MLDLPNSTEFNKRIPKQAFYDNLSVTAELKRVFSQQINLIYWARKIAPSTLNVGEGKLVTELEVFEIKLNQKSLDPKVLRLIDKEIPYHILYLLEYKNEYQAWIGYKEVSSAKAETLTAGSYYHTEWLPPDKLRLQVEGLNMDAVYDSFIRQIAGERLAALPNDNRNTESLKDAVKRDEKRQKPRKLILWRSRLPMRLKIRLWQNNFICFTRLSIR